MFIKIFYFIVFVSSVLSRHVPRYADLDDEDQHLLRAAYATPAYDHDEYQEDDDMPLGKLDLLKDGLWAVKAKIKELKAFNKALAANFLATKLKVKELLASSVALKKHHHGEIEKKKPAYNYQAPSYQQQYAPQSAPPSAPQSTPQYAPPSAPQSAPQYASPSAQQSAPQYAPQYAELQYAPPQHQHDPYYGH